MAWPSDTARAARLVWCSVFALSCTEEAGSQKPEPVAWVVPVAALDAIPSLLHDSGALRRGLELLLDPLPRPIRALRLEVLPDRVLLQVQDRSQPLHVQQYRFKGGAVDGPVQVELTGPGGLEDNLFALERADLNGISRLAAQAERRAALDRGRAMSLTLQRNMPTSMDVRFSVEVKGTNGKRLIEARKDGRILSAQPQPR